MVGIFADGVVKIASVRGETIISTFRVLGETRRRKKMMNTNTSVLEEPADQSATADEQSDAANPAIDTTLQSTSLKALQAHVFSAQDLSIQDNIKPLDDRTMTDSLLENKQDDNIPALTIIEAIAKAKAMALALISERASSKSMLPVYVDVST